MHPRSNEYELLLSKRKNRSGKRKRKGKLAQGWEQLRERGVLGISTIEGGGLVSAPIVGKALPGIGKRLIRRFALFNPKPKDADNDNVVQEGTMHERPAKPNLPSLPKTPAVARTPYENKTPYGGNANLIKRQRRQTKRFEKWAKVENWKRFHREHFDWWTFPIDRGSAAYGYEFTPGKDDLEKLKGNIPYLQSLRRAASLYALSMAWSLEDGDWIKDPDFDRGQEPLVNVNQARLFKIARSMQIHGLQDEFRSMRSMVQSLRDAGVKVGNEDYWDNPHAYKYAPLSPINTVMQQALPNPESSTGNRGVTGAMGISFTPFLMDSIDGGEQRFDIHEEEKFKQRYEKFDTDIETDYHKALELAKRNEGGIKDMNAFIAWIVGNSEIDSFYWRDDRTRVEHAKYLQLDDRAKPGTNNKNGKKLRLYPVSVKERRAERSSSNKEAKKAIALFEKYFGWVEAVKSRYPAVYDMSQALTQTASTPSRADVSNINLIQSLLGILDKYSNPTNYERAFQEWIRNPLIVAKDKTGKVVGVRLAYNNDRAAMLAEFDRRISAIKDEIAQIYSIDRKQLDRKLSPSQEARKYIDETNSQIKDRLISALKNIINNDEFKSTTNLEQISYLVAEELKRSVGLEERKRGFNGEVLRQLLNRPENLPMLGAIMRAKPRLNQPTGLDDVEPATLFLARMVVDEQALKASLKNTEPTIEAVRKEIGDVLTDSQIRELITERVERLGVSGNMSTGRSITGSMSAGGEPTDPTVASYTKVNPDKPRSFVNHVASMNSGYLSLPEPTDSIDEAIATGRPISWLMPGQLDPAIEGNYNSLINEIVELGPLNTLSLSTAEYSLMDGGSFTKKQIAQQDKLVKDFENIKHRHAAVFSALLAARGVTDRNDNHTMSYGLVQRAVTDAIRANYLKNKFKSEEMTQDILQELQADVEDIFASYDIGGEETINITVPASVLENIFADGKLKTQHETKTSGGSLNTDLRNLQEFAMFSIHPKAKQRPIYGAIRRGTNEEISETTQQYGAATIVLKSGAEKRTTWTQADSLSFMASTSTLTPNRSTWDGLFNQTLHQHTKDSYFYSREVAAALEEFGAPLNERNWPFIEAQVHGGVSVDDISHIIVDEDYYQNWPEQVQKQFGAGYDQDNWMESPKWQGIMQTAESLGIQIVLLRDGLTDYELLEEPEI